jgi:hypothetical protein
MAKPSPTWSLVPGSRQYVVTARRPVWTALVIWPVDLFYVNYARIALHYKRLHFTITPYTLWARESSEQQLVAALPLTATGGRRP